MALIAVSIVPLPVMMMTSGGSTSARTCLSTSRPSSSGITMSSSATSYASARRASSAARPSVTVLTA